MTTPIHELWDNYRDGTLDDAQRADFETYLRENPAEAERYEQESQWLDQLRTADTAATLADGNEFVTRVLEEWDDQDDAPMPIPFPRQRVWRYAAGVGIAAAFIGMVTWMGFTRSSDPRIAIDIPEADPLSVLVEDIHKQAGRAPRDPAALLYPHRYRIRQDDVLSMLSVPGSSSHTMFDETLHADNEQPWHGDRFNHWMESMNVRYNPLSGTPLEVAP